MGFGKLIKGFFGGSKAPEMSDDPFGRKQAPIEIPAPEKPPTPKRPAGLIVNRDEIIGGRSRLMGYRFQVRPSDGVGTGDAAAVVAVLKADNIQAVAQRRMALVPLLPGQWAQADFQGLATENTYFLVDTPRDGCSAAEFLNELSSIRQAGGKVAVWATAFGAYEAALAASDLLVVDFHAYSLENFERLVRRVRAAVPGVMIAAEGVTSWTEHRLCQGLGVQYSLGGFAASPDEEHKAEKINQSRLTLIEMLNLLRQQADLAELVEVAKRDPGVVVKIIDMANSPLSGLGEPVASVNLALMMLGRDTLYRWLSLGIYRAGSMDQRDEMLLEIALTRARFLELVAAVKFGKPQSDELFLVGMLSLLDCLLGMPMPKVLERMTLPQVVVDVLSKSEGPYGRYLLLAMCVEKGGQEQAARLAAELDISVEQIDECSAEALVWAEEALGQSGGGEHG